MKTITYKQLRKFLAEAKSISSDFKIDGTVLKRYKGKGGDIVIPNGITDIGAYAFLDTYGVTSITIPPSVKYIGDSAFHNFRGENIKVYISDLRAWCNISWNSVTPFFAKRNHLVLNGKELTHLTIPSDVTYIGGNAFSGCDSIRSLKIPNSVTSIGYHAFGGCDNLTGTLIIPDSVTELGKWAFRNTDITSLKISNGITTIPEYAFGQCPKLKSIIIPDSITSIDKNAFEMCYELDSVVIPDSVTKIARTAFWSCKKLKAVKLPPHLFKEILKDPDRVFLNTPFAERLKNCKTEREKINVLTTMKVSKPWISELDTVQIPDDAVKVTPDMISPEITEIVIPNSVKTIAANSFSKCSDLKEIVIGVGVKEIEQNAFKDVPDDIVVYVPNFSYCEFLIDSGLPDSATIIVKRSGKRFSTKFSGLDEA